jgi:hypothetical protein
MSNLSPGSISADQPLSMELNSNSDDLQPCIEDIRLEIDRLRREEQLLREKYIKTLSFAAFHFL